MPKFPSGEEHLHYDDLGDGRLIIATHGMMSPAYWAISGVAGVLGLKRRFVAMDLRAHGRNRSATGCNVETMAQDIGALADHLKVEKFHLLGHATGGMTAMRYAMRNSDRLESLIVMDTSPHTAPLPPEHFEKQAELIESTAPEDIYEVVNRTPAGLFQSRLDVIPNSEDAKAMVSAMFARNDTALIGQFMREYFCDRDAQIDLLREITCPTLCLVGEHDPPFHEDIKMIANNVPGAEHAVLPGIGHHCAIESPWKTITIIEDFLDRAEHASKDGQ